MMQMGWYKAEQWYVYTCLNYLLETELNGRVGHTIMHENHSRDGIQVGGYKTEQWYVYTCSNYLLETELNCKASHTIMHENHCRDGTQMGGCITNSVTYMSHPISELWAWTNRIHVINMHARNRKWNWNMAEIRWVHVHRVQVMTI